MPRQSVFSRRLRQAREAAGLYQKWLGIVIGLDPGVASTRIYRYEQAVHLPDIDTAQWLADRLQVPLPYLFTDDDGLARVILDYARSAAKGAAYLRFPPLVMGKCRHVEDVGRLAASGHDHRRAWPQCPIKEADRRVRLAAV